ncbi:MAG: LamB/YcsF family protein, partial [Pseudomonadota bacterium]|nr:LamB/YcsF family protein [Pseudomonadota bacterium]
MKIDLNSDLGESWGAYIKGEDSDVLKIITSANIACGYHAGDPLVMTETIKTAIENNVSVGAHPSFMDLQGFGRRRL